MHHSRRSSAKAQKVHGQPPPTPQDPHPRKRAVIPSTRGLGRHVVVPMYRAEERAGAKTSVNKALMRGLDRAIPYFILGLSLSSVGRRSDDRPHGFLGTPGVNLWERVDDLAIRAEPRGTPMRQHQL